MRINKITNELDIQFDDCIGKVVEVRTKDVEEVGEFASDYLTFTALVVEYGSDTVLVDLDLNAVYPDIQNYVITKVFESAELICE